MKKCSFCGTEWQGFRTQPRPREKCEVCGRFLHACSNCMHLDRSRTSRCRLEHTTYVGPRDVLNYCEEFRMLDTAAMQRELKLSQARLAWEQLFKR